MTGAQALAVALPVLRAAGVADPVRDARVLLAHALAIDRSRLTLVLADAIAPAVKGRFDAMVGARAKRQPVAQIVGGRAFYGRWFRVTGDVLDPRPETECLIERALAEPFGTVLDLGTGSGCILLSLLAERDRAIGTGTDIAPAALAVAARTADDLGLTPRAKFMRSDWWQAVRGRFDLIVANPPYISAAELADLAPEVRDWEPHAALSPGGDGLGAYRRIAPQARQYLAPSGRLIVEIGASQGAAVSALFRSAGLDEVAVCPDLDGRDRLVSARAA